MADKRRSITPELVAEMERLIKEGMPKVHVAKTLGIATISVYRYTKADPKKVVDRKKMKEEISRLYLESGMFQREIAEKLNICQSTVYRALRGVRKPKRYARTTPRKKKVKAAQVIEKPKKPIPKKPEVKAIRPEDKPLPTKHRNYSGKRLLYINDKVQVYIDDSITNPREIDQIKKEKLEDYNRRFKIA